MNAAEIEALHVAGQTLALVPFLVETPADLRDKDASRLLGGELAVVQAPAPRLYVWAPTASFRDDGRGAIAPLGLSASGGAGRWLLIAVPLLRFSFTYDPPNLVDGAGDTQNPTSLQGVALGDFVAAGFTQDLQGMLLTAWASAANEIKTRLQNETGGALNLASGTVYLLVWKK